MNIVVVGGAGFIGTNLAIKLSKIVGNNLIIVDKTESYFDNLKSLKLNNTHYLVDPLNMDSNFDFLNDQDIVYHLVSTNMPSNSNINITNDLYNNVLYSSKLFEKCVKMGVKKIVFLSSGGTVYGRTLQIPIVEDCNTNPISSYGLQKLTIEKLLYLYNYLYGIKYSIIRLSNPYGPYQRPNGQLGALTTFIYKALHNQLISVYGDGSIVRDYIYIDDAIEGIIQIANSSYNDVFNFGSGVGVSILELLMHVEKELNVKLNIEFLPSRNVDVNINVLNIDKYISYFGKPKMISIEEGIVKTKDYFANQYK